jgi:hypothetical protein
MASTNFPIYRNPCTKATRQRRADICLFLVAVKRVLETTIKLYLNNLKKSTGSLSAAIIKND